MEKTLLNLIPGACSPEVHLSQYDKGRAIPFKLAEGKSAYSVPDGSEIVVEATKPSGLGFVVPVTFDGDTATMTVTETMSNEYGRFPAELSITKNGNKIGTANFVMNIERSPHPEGTTDGDAETIIPELTLLVERIEAAADSVDEDTQIVTEAKADVLQAKADTLQAKADTLSARDDALQAKADAITAKESAEASAQAAAESAQEAEDTLSEYAKVDGYYEEMAVGSAEQLLSTQFVEDSVPYKFRTSGGSKDIGNREYDEIVGGSIVWNQLINGNFEEQAIWNPINGTLQVASNIGSYTVTTVGQYAYSNSITQHPPLTVKGHKYLCVGHIKPAHNKSDIRFWINGGSSGSNQSSGIKTAEAGKWNSIAGIINCDRNNGYLQFALGCTSSDGYAIGDVDELKNIMCFDLTQMFGSTVADYIYSLESAEAGKGVAFFKSMFPKDYYPYNAGELLSVEGLQSHDTVGFNAFDNSTFVKGRLDNGVIGYASDTTDLTITSNGVNFTTNVTYRGVVSGKIKIVPNSIYTMMYEAPPNTVGVYLDAYDVNDNWIRRLNATYTSESTGARPILRVPMPSNCDYVRLSIQLASTGSVEVSKICLHLTWSGWRDSEYEPYKKHSYPLDSSLTLRGIPKLNAQNELYFDGDIYSHDGKVQRKYGVVDLGSLTWSKGDTTSGHWRFGATFSLAKKPSSADSVPNVMCKKYPATSTNSVYLGNSGITINNSSGNIQICDEAYSDATAFKTAMNGVMLVYELATPTEETAEPYASPQNVDDFGTEEYISGNVVPVGHNTKYPANLRDKLQHLPNMADSDGAYLIRQTNKQMSLEVFRIPKAPTTDGTYTLKATVSGGTPTYTWEAVE